MQTRVIAVIALFGCGEPPLATCPGRPSHLGEGITMQCVANECEIGDLNWPALSCEQIGPWQSFSDCSFRASFRCANERSAVVMYEETRATFDIRGAECKSSYVLSAEPMTCN